MMFVARSTTSHLLHTVRFFLSLRSFSRSIIFVSSSGNIGAGGRGRVDSAIFVMSQKIINSYICCFVSMFLGGLNECESRFGIFDTTIHTRFEHARPGIVILEI